MRIFAFALLLLSPFFLYAQDGFVVTVKLDKLDNKKIRVLTLKNGKSVWDTISPVEKDLVIWKGRTEEPQLVRMEVLDTTLYLRTGKAVATPPSLNFLLNNAPISIKGNSLHIYDASLKSKDPEVVAYEKFRKDDTPLTKEGWALQGEMSAKINAKDTVGVGAIKERLNVLKKTNQALRWAYVDKNPKAFASIIFLQNLFLIFSAEEIAYKYEMLDEKYKNTATAKALELKIASNRRTAPGKPVIPFAQTGVDGNLVDVAALKGKVLLIDFWGSWCVPCRQSHPGLLQLYNQYKSKGFEIIGVSNERVNPDKPMDQQQAAWRKAIKDDNINWLHVLYNPEIQDIIKQYDINGYPTKFLIDQKGNFVMKLPGNSAQMHEQLSKKLEEMLGK